MYVFLRYSNDIGRMTINILPYDVLVEKLPSFAISGTLAPAFAILCRDKKKTNDYK